MRTFLLRTPLLVVLAVLPGCGALLGLDDFADEAPSGNASSSAGGTGASGGSGGSGASSGGEGGSGATGGGGSGPTLNCANKGPAFDILTPTDLNNVTLDDQQLLLIPDEASSSVHLVVVASQEDAIYLRTVTNDAEHVQGSPVVYDPGFQGSPRLMGGIATQGNVRVYGIDQETIQRFDAAKQGNSVVGPFALSPAFTPPLDCQQPAHFRNAVVAPDPNAASYAMCCEKDGSYRSLWVASDGSPPQKVLSSGPNDEEVVPRRIETNGVGSLLVSGADFGPPLGFRYGPDPAALATFHPFAMSSEPNTFSALFGVAPKAGPGNGILVFAATIKAPPTLVPATLYSGEFDAIDFPKLAQVPPPGFEEQYTITTSSDIGLFNALHPSDLFVVAAGLNPLQDRVLLTVFNRHGSVLIPNQEIVTPGADEAFLAADAVQLDALTIVVAWVRKLGGAYSVRGQILFCSG